MLDAVSYLPFIVTMAVSVAVCEIFSVKEWRDLENQIRGYLNVDPRSSRPRSFDYFLQNTFYVCFEPKTYYKIKESKIVL